MRTRLLSALLAYLVALCALGGASAEAAPAAVDPAEALAAYRAVLLGDAPFYSSEQQADVLLSSLAEPNLVVEFALADLDADGAAELVLALGTQTDPYVSREVLRYADGRVVGWNLPYRGMSVLTADGAYCASSSAADTAWLRMAFGPDGYEGVALARSESAEDGGVRFYVNGEEADEAAFLAACAPYEAAEAARWYPYAPEGVREAFPEE